MHLTYHLLYMWNEFKFYIIGLNKELNDICVKMDDAMWKNFATSATLVIIDIGACIDRGA